MNNTLLVIDAYISNLERAAICEKLIGQIKKVRPNQPILLLNKSGESYGVEKKVDYYYNHGHSFMVGYPPQELLDSDEYSKPYVYFETDSCILENWMPYVNVTDHVANIYNSFILSSRISKMLGLSKFVRIEFDIDFDLTELDSIFNEIDRFQKALIFGLRKEGLWMGEHQYLIDVHISGFSNDVFDEYDLVWNDEQYWEVCKKIGYYGKWIEYVIPAIYYKYNLSRTNENLDPISPFFIRKQYPKTKFDVVNSPGEWKNKWYEMPKLSKVVIKETDIHDETKLGVFFYNADFDTVQIKTKLYDSEDQIILEKDFSLNKNVWFYEVIPFNGYARMESIYVDHDGKEHIYTKEVDENFSQLNCRMLMK